MLQSDDPAELLRVCSLEVGVSKEIEPKKSYQVGFTVSLKNKWPPNSPIFVMVKRGEKGNFIARKVVFDHCQLNEKFDIPGNFVIKFLRGDSSEPTIHIRLYDHWTSHWKYGLQIHQAFVREVNNVKEGK